MFTQFTGDVNNSAQTGGVLNRTPPTTTDAQEMLDELTSDPTLVKDLIDKLKAYVEDNSQSTNTQSSDDEEDRVRQMLDMVLNNVQESKEKLNSNTVIAEDINKAKDAVEDAQNLLGEIDDNDNSNVYATDVATLEDAVKKAQDLLREIGNNPTSNLDETNVAKLSKLTNTNATNIKGGSYTRKLSKKQKRYKTKKRKSKKQKKKKN